MRNYQDREWLTEHYVRQGLSCQQCAEASGFGVTGAAVHGWLRRHGIPARPVGEHMKGDSNPRLGKPVPEQTREKIRMANTGHVKTPEAIRKQAEAIRGNGNPQFGKPRQHGKGLTVILPDGKRLFLRSRWEAVFADYLCGQGANWLYEPETFRLTDGSAYTPDFLTEGVYYEVKGYMNTADQAKVDGFRSAFPGTPLVVADEGYLNSIGLHTGNNCLNSLHHIAIAEEEKRVCPVCDRSFVPPTKQAVYCSVACNARKPKKPPVAVVCEVCGKAEHFAPSVAKTRRTCSRQCADILRGRESGGANHWTHRR